MKSRLVVMILMTVVSCMFGQVVGYSWVETNTYTGHGVCTTAPFRIWGNKWRVSYAPNGNTPFEIRLVNLDQSLEIPLVKQSKTSKNGEYSGKGAMKWGYLVIRSSRRNDKNWKVSLQQYLDKADEWSFEKWKKEPLESGMTMFGSWSGEAGEKELEIDVPEGCGRMTFKQFGNGRLKVEVLHGDTIVSQLTQVEPGEASTWLYATGQYKVRISAMETPWNLKVEKFNVIQ